MIYNCFLSNIVINKMKKTLLMIAASLALAACGSEKEGDKAESVVSAESAMPQECKAYLDQMNELISANPAMAEQFKEAIKATEDQWKDIPEASKAAAIDACKQATEQLKLIPKG